MALEIIIRLIQGGLMAWLWRQGGKGNKFYRNIVVPILIFIITRNIIVALLFVGITRVPISLIGDDLKTHGQLFWWVPILCLLHAAPLYFIAGLIPAASLFVLQLAMIIGSNTLNFPTWNWYEKIYGFALGLFLRNF